MAGQQILAEERTHSPETIDWTLRDAALSAQLRVLGENDPDFWSFRSNAVRQHAHAFFQYPAMMVPQMQERLLAEFTAIDPSIKKVYDPFVGSGTVLTETMLRGLDFHGCDINPLAILLARVKAGPFYVTALRDRWREIEAEIRADKCSKVESSFFGLCKWFTGEVAICLSRIVRSIRRDKDLWSRRFFWVALAETVRITSNSRTSTFKLHLRPSKELEERSVDPISVFRKVVDRNLVRTERNAELLRNAGSLRSGHYTGNITLKLAHAADDAKSIEADNRADLLVTSPPYGDNVSTVPYGQHSFLPLRWIDLDDISHELDQKLVANTHSLDTRSLGGSRKNALEGVQPACEMSPSLLRTLKLLAFEPRDRRLRVAAFWRDLDRCLTPIIDALRANAYMVWVVGNRRVGDRVVPMHEILAELVTARGGVPVAILERHIHSKRMALRNGIAKTMSRETILVMRKGA
ncbi:MAG TPA: site-specific DNA-methyltransferase [Thermoanaerobaculia bacterium]|nr:site-specific DNA-methyltransferase [Thermoanaerobaculia bacterium]